MDEHVGAVELRALLDRTEDPKLDLGAVLSSYANAVHVSPTKVAEPTQGGREMHSARLRRCDPLISK